MDPRDEPTAAEVASNLERIRDRIAAVERSWDHEVEVTAVTKAKPGTVIAHAVAAGLRSVGENYAQELVSKRDALDALDPDARPRVDFIGRLQSNKVRLLVDLVDRWCTVDRDSLVAEIAKRAPGAHVLVQVDATDEEGKGGCRPERASGLVDACRDAGLVVDGLLTVGPTAGPPEAAAPGFRLVRSLVDDLGLEVCSMGMTGDLEVAVAAGSTEVRIGSALFGARPPTAAAPATPVHPDGDRRG